MAASRILGSNVLAATKTLGSQQHAVVHTGCLSIDQALGGGFNYGSITSIAGFNQTDKTMIAIHAVASHLTSSVDTDVAFICTAESGLPIQLHDVLIGRLRKSQHSSSLKPDLEQEVSTLLHRVKLMRVFDFVGILESIGEISESYRLTRRDLNRKQQTSWDPKEIPSSQDEEQDLSDATNSLNEAQEDVSEARGMGLVVIDNISNLLTGEIAKDQVEGQSLLAGFFRSLHHLTLNYHICTILINSVVIPSHQVESKPKLEETISIFRNFHGRPGLGPNYAHLVDTSLLLFDVPKTEIDTEKATVSNQRRSGRSECVKVIEVIGSRYCYTEGKWGAFTILDGRHLVPIYLKQADLSSGI